MLEIRGLAKRYGGGDPALRGVDLSVSADSVVALIGPSGSGKSTLIRCINRLVEPSAGSVVLDGVELTRLGGAGLRAARRRIGMIFQEHALIERLTVMENLLSGRLGSVGFFRAWLRRFPSTDIEAAFALLERVGLGGLHDRRADALSGGQRQRVGIARALMQRPSLLLVDEPTASLDPKTSRSVMRLITGLARERGLAVIVNMHDVPLALRFADRVVGLHAGAIVHDGPPASVSEEVLTRIYGAEDWLGTAAEGEAEEDEATAPAAEA